MIRKRPVGGILVAFLLGCGTPPASSDMASVVDDFLEQEQFHGVVVVATDDTTLVARARGMADREARVATTLDTRYQLGSIAKWITTLAVLRLVDQGVLSLDAPIARHLPEHREDVASQVTLHHLLSHTSGVPNDLVAAYQADPAQLKVEMPAREAVRRHANGALRFAPGSAFDYSHSNWILVQALVEAVTGTSFDVALHRLVFDPAGLEATGTFSATDTSMATIAPGYASAGPPPVRADLPAPSWLRAAGGIYSTAPDLVRLLTAVYRDGFLADTTLARLDRVVTVDPDLSAGGLQGGYALGGRIRGMAAGGGMRVLWHTGSNGPSKARVSRVLPSGLTIITLANDDTDHDRTGALVEAIITHAAREATESDAQ